MSLNTKTVSYSD